MIDPDLEDVVAVEAPERVVARAANDESPAAEPVMVSLPSPPLIAAMPVSSVVLKSSVWLVQSP